MARSSPPGPLEVPGGKIAYDAAGSGDPIVFIHAAIADRRMWEREFEVFAKGHRLIRYDTRGLGQSPPARESYSDIEDLRALHEALRLGSATLVGCSNGGRLALDFALAHPSAVRALLLVAPGLSGFDGSSDPEGQPDFEADGKRSNEIFEAWAAGRKDEALERLCMYWCSRQTGENLDLVRRMLRENANEIFTDESAKHSRPLEPPAIERLRSVRVPTRILYGDHDEPTVGWIAHRIATEVPGAVFVSATDADHLVNLSRPDLFDDALRSLLG